MNKSQSTDQANFTEVFRTGRLWEIELAASEFKKHNIPFYQQEQTSSGLKFAKPIAPAMAPGLWWVIYVSQNALQDAESILAELPVEKTENPGVWHYNASNKPNRILRWYYIFILLAFAAYVFDGIIDLVKMLIDS